MNRYMRKPYRCNVCYKPFDTFYQARAHWFSAHENDSDSMTPTNQPAPPDEAQDAEDARREAALAKIAEIDEELGLYDDEAQGDTDWTERTRARILHNTDPDVVAEHSRRMAEWSEFVGTPKRCKVGEVHPASGECLFCGAANGQSCKLGFGG